MKRIFLFSFLAFAFAVPSAFAQVAPDDRYAGYPASLVKWPASWPDLNQCKNQEYYEPLDTHLTRYASRAKIAGYRVQESDECVWMLTRNSWRWVLRPAGTKVAVDAQGRDLLDGGSPTGNTCMNPRPISIPIPSRPVAEAAAPAPPIRFSPPPAPRPEPRVYTPPPPQSEPEPRVVYVPVERQPPPAPEPEPRVVYVQKPASENRAGFTFGVVPMFSSFPVSGTLNEITGREWCVEGTSFDVGLAYGRPKGSYWRFTFHGSPIKDGSFTRPEKYRIEVVNNVKVFAGKVERVFRLSLSENSPVALMATAGAGVGFATGNGAEVFGSSAFFVGGAGVGALVDLGKNATLGVTAIGYEHPGRHFGRVHLSVWF